MVAPRYALKSKAPPGRKERDKDGAPSLDPLLTRNPGYWIELPTCEKTLLALEPIRRTVPTTMTRITASMTEYSAMSWPSSSDQNRFSHAWLIEGLRYE